MLFFHAYNYFFILFYYRYMLYICYWMLSMHSIICIIKLSYYISTYQIVRYSVFILFLYSFILTTKEVVRLFITKSLIFLIRAAYHFKNCGMVWLLGLTDAKFIISWRWAGSAVVWGTRSSVELYLQTWDKYILQLIQFTGQQFSNFAIN